MRRHPVRQACTLEGVDQAEEERHQHDRAEDTTLLMPEVLAEAQRHQNDARRVDRGEHRDRERNQLGQAQVGHQQREHREDDHQCLVGQRQHSAEVLGAGTGQADRGHQARQGNQHGQETTAQRTEGVLHVSVQYRRAIGSASGHFMAARTETEQADIHQRQADTSDQAGDDCVAGDQGRRLDAA
ncbi:hypothetical protein D3C78_808010 [compost metagenome]